MEALSNAIIPDTPASPEPSEPSLVDRLCSGWHKVRVVVRPENSFEAFKEALERGFVQIEFTETRGGTVLGFPVEIEQNELSKVRVNSRDEKLMIAGTLTLNFQKVRCTALIDLNNLAGEGKLELIH
jgi:hypothetical protein